MPHSEGISRPRRVGPCHFLELSAGTVPAFVADLGDSEAPPVTKDALALMTRSQLRILRNWIYAAHGMIFKPQDLAVYFADRHRPRFDNVDQFLTPEDKDKFN